MLAAAPDALGRGAMKERPEIKGGADRKSVV